MAGTIFLQPSVGVLRSACSSLPQQRLLQSSCWRFSQCRRQLSSPSSSLFSAAAGASLRSARMNKYGALGGNCGRSFRVLDRQELFQWKRMMSSEKPAGKESGETKEPAIDEPSSKKPRLLSRLPIPTHENIYTIPNILTFSRLAAAPMVGYFILTSNPVMALSLFAYASITDLVDGYLARRWGQQTVVGSVIDPMADKTLMTVGVICLAMNSAIPIWLAGLILARDVGLAISAIYYRWISLPPPKTMARYWDFSLPSAEVKPTQISKVNTALQFFLVGSAMTMPVIPEAFLSAWSLHEGMIGLQYLVAVTTAWSGLSYVYSKDAVKILTHDEVEKKMAEKKGKDTGL